MRILWTLRHHIGFSERGREPPHASGDSNQSARCRSAWPTYGNFSAGVAAAYVAGLVLVGSFPSYCPRLRSSKHLSSEAFRRSRGVRCFPNRIPPKSKGRRPPLWNFGSWRSRGSPARIEAPAPRDRERGMDGQTDVYHIPRRPARATSLGHARTLTFAVAPVVCLSQKLVNRLVVV